MNKNILLNISAYLGLIFAPFLAIVETVHNWGDWGNPAFWIIDYVACALVFAGAMDWFRQVKKGPKAHNMRCVALLTGGWGFACAMFWMAFFLYFQEYQRDPNSVESIVMIFVSVLFVWTVIGFSFALTGIIRSND